MTTPGALHNVTQQRRTGTIRFLTAEAVRNDIG